jgi:hypothetical protein
MFRNIKNKKGYWYFGVGSLFIVLVVLFVVIAIVSPGLGNKITGALTQLFGSIGG